jgi:hypothetical protein
VEEAISHLALVRQDDKSLCCLHLVIFPSINKSLTLRFISPRVFFEDVLYIIPIDFSTFSCDQASLPCVVYHCFVYPLYDVSIVFHFYSEEMISGSLEEGSEERSGPCSKSRSSLLFLIRSRWDDKLSWID